jgi:hypothetical protein
VLFEKNMAIIAKRFPHLVKWLTDDTGNEGTEVEVLQSKTGLPIPRLSRDGQRVFLNSSYDPELEADRWLTSLVDEQHKGLLIYGSGFLYHLRAVLQAKKFTKVVCYEPSVKVLRSCLAVIDFEELLQYDWLLLGGTSYVENIENMNLYLRHTLVDLKVAVLPAYYLLYNTETMEFGQHLKDKMRIFHVNMVTSNATGEKWILNSFENLKHVNQTPGVRHFFDQFKKVPAFIVSGGPSLEKNIHLLKELQEKAVIICAGSSVRAALKKGVTPHFLVNIDGNPLNSVLYNELDLKDVCLLYNVRSYPGMLDKYAGRKIHMKMDVEQFSDMISFKSGGYDFGMIRSGFSCAHTALDFAFKLGCNPIVFIGQDLAYTDNKRYADGQVSEVQKFVTEEQLPPGCLLVKDIYGADVVTDQEFQNFKLWFEEIIEKYYKNDSQLINATEGGQPIEGVENQPLVEVILKYCQEYRGISWKIRKNYEKGQREWRKYSAQASCIPAQIEFLLKEALTKIAQLMDRTQELRKLNFSHAEFQKDSLEPMSKQIIAEYESLLSYSEYEVMLVDFKASKHTVMVVKLAELEPIENKEKYETKLVYILNILIETKIYLERIRECNQKSITIGEMADGQRFKANGDRDSQRPKLR